MLRRASIFLSAACVLVAGSSVTLAQLMPGFRAPDSKLDAVKMTHRTGCFLASANRPVPGINMDAGDLAGEGLTEKKQAPEWLASIQPISNQSRLATLDTPEGPIWITFDMDSGLCTIAVQTDDQAKFVEDYATELKNDKNWKRKKDKSNGGYYFQQKLAGLKFITKFPNVPNDAKVFLVNMHVK